MGIAKYMNTCLFCSFEFQSQRKIYENDFFYSIFDMSPASPGHSLIIPKVHKLSLLDLNFDEWTVLRNTLSEVIKIIEKTNLTDLYTKLLNENIDSRSVSFVHQMLQHPRINSKPDAYNHGVNDGIAAGRTVHHLHWHIIPRYKGDVIDPTGGVRYVIPAMGNYKKS